MFASIKYITFYVFYRYKPTGNPTPTQHLLTESVRRPDDDRFKMSKHLALYNKIAVLEVY